MMSLPLDRSSERNADLVEHSPIDQLEVGSSRAPKAKHYLSIVIWYAICYFKDMSW